MKTTKESNKHKHNTTHKSPPNAIYHRKSFNGECRQETGDIFRELCRERGKYNKSWGSVQAIFICRRQSIRHLKSLPVRKANDIKMQDMNTEADKFGIIGNYVDTTGKTFKKSQSIYGTA